MKKIISLLIVVIVTNFPFSCGYDDDCGSLKPQTYVVRAMDARIGSYDSLGFNDLRNLDAKIAAVGIRITRLGAIDVEVSHFPKLSSFLSNQALACSPAEPKFTQRIAFIEIYSTEAVYEIFTPGQLLNDLFKVTRTENLGIEEYIEAQNDNPEILGDSKPIVLQLRSSPDTKIDQLFEIKFGFDNGDVFDIVTQYHLIVNPE